METKSIIQISGDLYIEKECLIIKYGLHYNTVYNGINDNVLTKSWVSFEYCGKVYVLYRSIPIQSRKKLPSLEVLSKHCREEFPNQSLKSFHVAKVLLALDFVYTQHHVWSRHIGLYEDIVHYDVQRIKLCRIHAIYEIIIQLHDEGKIPLCTIHETTVQFFKSK